MQCGAVWCSVLQYVAVCCSSRTSSSTATVTVSIFGQTILCLLQCLILCCSVLHCVASVLQHQKALFNHNHKRVNLFSKKSFVCCNVLQCFVMCSVPECLLQRQPNASQRFAQTVFFVRCSLYVAAYSSVLQYVTVCCSIL